MERESERERAREREREKYDSVHGRCKNKVRPPALPGRELPKGGNVVTYLDSSRDQAGEKVREKRKR